MAVAVGLFVFASPQAGHEVCHMQNCRAQLHLQGYLGGLELKKRLLKAIEVGESLTPTSSTAAVSGTAKQAAFRYQQEAEYHIGILMG